MRFVFLLLFALLSAQPALAAMYKWVDEKGVTHYGDTPPPQYAGEAGKKGAGIKKTEPVLTPEQRKAREEELARKNEQEQKAREQKRRDAALLNTYTSVKEMDLARDRNLQQAEAQIQSAELRLKAVQNRLNQYRVQAEAVKRGNKPVPADLTQSIKDAEKEIQQLQENIAKSRQEKEAIKAKFEADKQRFLELSAGAQGK